MIPTPISLAALPQPPSDDTEALFNRIYGSPIVSISIFGKDRVVCCKRVNLPRVWQTAAGESIKEPMSISTIWAKADFSGWGQWYWRIFDSNTIPF